MPTNKKGLFFLIFFGVILSQNSEGKVLVMQKIDHIREALSSLPEGSTP